jgi:adenylate cyclase class 1
MKDLLESIAKNRDAFAGYTIARLRELLRNLPPSKNDLFHSIPFFLHVNAPEFPGYVDSEHAIHGIFRFEQTGFFKYAVRTFNLTQDHLNAICPGSPVILGLYLMGSAGTLTQTRTSDFDYWVVIREKKLTPDQVEQLSIKLKRIETWCRKKHGQEVTFFLQDIEKLRRNEFSTVDGESSGSAQRTLLKDEFYRTFIMIAGKIPLWAVLPDTVTQKQRVALNNPEALNRDYIDTGMLTAIDRRECLGAILWQIYKARKDPVKSMIKSSLCAYYAFNGEQENLASTAVKAGFSRTLIDDYLYDPYIIVFEKIIEFYTDMNDPEGLELIRCCIYLRLLSYPHITMPEENSPKGRLLTRFVSEWNPERPVLTRLRDFTSLSEEEKIDFEDRIFDKLSFIYELILRSGNDDDSPLSMSRNDLNILKNRTAAFLQKKPGKLPRCSTGLKARAELKIKLIKNPVDDSWFASDVSEWDRPPLFTGPEFTKTLGWVFANALHQSLDTSTSPLLEETAGFLSKYFPRPDHVFAQDPFYEGMLIVLTVPGQDGTPQKADILLVNSWGEVFYESLDLSAIESMENKWYTLKIHIGKCQLIRPDVRLNYLVCRDESLQRFAVPETMKHPAALEKATELSGVKPPVPRDTSGDKTRKSLKPFLDKL